MFDCLISTEIISVFIHRDVLLYIFSAFLYYRLKFALLREAV
jgi:hypothetical protein